MSSKIHPGIRGILMRNRLFAVWLVGACCLLAGCEADNQNDAQRFKTRLEQGLASAVASTHAPGGVLVVRFTDGSILRAAHGNATLAGTKQLPGGAERTTDTAPARPMNLTDRFRIGSVTKTFVGTAVLILVKEGSLSLEDTLETVLPGVYSKGNQVTVRQLLDHSSAIPDYAATDDFADIYIDDLEHVWTEKELIDLVDDEELLDVPGRNGYYSNTNYLFLGMIIERFSKGRTLEEFMAERIFEPLGLANTSFPTENTIQGAHTDGYFDYNGNDRFEPDEKATDQSPTAIWAAGMIVSTPDDLLVWLDELMTGILITPELQAERMKMNIPMAGAPDGINLGLGIADLMGPIGHTGAVAGYTTNVFRYKNVDFVTCSNGYHTTGTTNIANEIFDTAKAIVCGEND
jgi:D-alanyl-D-alanine carboxypeptidase